MTRKPTPPITREPLPSTPAADGTPITDVNKLPIVSSSVAATIKAAAGLVTKSLRVSAAKRISTQPQVDKPGTERWAVKTSQDIDRAKVGKNVIGGVDLGAGIVQATIEELVRLPRPPGLEDSSKDPLEFSNKRDGVTEITIWRIEATIIALKHESDGDYHLVLQGPSGQEMVGEIPIPTTLFVGDSPWIGNMSEARSQVDLKLVSHFKSASFVPLEDKYVPRGAMSMDSQTKVDRLMSFVTPPGGSEVTQPLFATAIPPTPARITGVGFFDRAHGQTGAAPNVIELHPVLKVEWL